MKYIFIFILIFLFTGCSKDNYLVEVHSLIEEGNTYILGIHYPTIGYNLFDKEITTYINKVKDTFLNQEMTNTIHKAELNIDYSYHIINNRYVNVLLQIFENQESFVHPKNSINTFVFDIKEKQFLSFSDLFTKEVLESNIGVIQTSFLKQYKECILLDYLQEVITPNLDNYSNFTFTNQDVTIYFNPLKIATSSCGVVSRTFPFTALPSKLQLYIESVEETSFTFLPNSREIDPSKKVVALTFDDGPGKYTSDLLSVLEENNAVGTFFILGNKVELYQDLLRRLLSLGNELGNHTYNHKSMNQLSTKELLKQINDTQDLIKSYTGFVPKFFRPTYGTLTKQGKKVIPLSISFWTIDTKDWKSNKSSEVIVSETMKKVKDKSVILMHDTHEKTVLTVSKLIPLLQEEGYQFVTLSELEEVTNVREDIFFNNTLS